MSFAGEKEKFLHMPLEEKRSQYKCKSYVTLDTIPSWTELFKANKDRLQSQLKESQEKEGLSPCTPNKDLCSKVTMWQGDITALEIDAIVNAANRSLLGGGGAKMAHIIFGTTQVLVTENSFLKFGFGFVLSQAKKGAIKKVDGAIHRGAGPTLKEECATLNGCDTGDAKITGGYRLPAKYVIHTVGPQGEKPKLLESCYETCLNIALKNDIKTIAFPCISTGIYGYPQDAAAKVALRTVRTFLDKNPDSITQIVFCLFLPQDVTIYENLLQVFFPVD